MNAKTKSKLKSCMWGLIILALIMLINFIVKGTFMLKCPFKLVTVLDCPACGLQRAVVAAFNGDFKQVFWMNPYLCMMLPYMMILGCVSILPTERAKRIFSKLSHPIVIIILGVLMLAWWILRNTEYWKDYFEICLQ